MNLERDIRFTFENPSNQNPKYYRICLNVSFNYVYFLLQQRLIFRVHDESNDSKHQEGLLKLLRFLACHNEDMINKIILHNAPQNNKLIAPKSKKKSHNLL